MGLRGARIGAVHRHIGVWIDASWHHPTVTGRRTIGLVLSLAVALAIGRAGSGSWSVAGLLVLIVSLIVWPLSRARDRKRKQAFGLAADTATEAVREFLMPGGVEATLDHAAGVMRSLDFVKTGTVRVDSGRRMVRARTRLTRDSWGEWLSIRVTPEEASVRVRVESRGLVPQLIDYGKNARNVAAITQRLLQAALSD